jgi:hypothetical protein
MRNKDEEQDAPSLIPDVREQEGLLKKELQEAQEDAEALAAQARQDAEGSLSRVRDEFAGSVLRLRDQGLLALKGELEAEQASLESDVQAIEDRDMARLSAAVQHVLTQVLPEGTA